MKYEHRYVSRKNNSPRWFILMKSFYDPKNVLRSISQLSPLSPKTPICRDGSVYFLPRLPISIVHRRKFSSSRVEINSLHAYTARGRQILTHPACRCTPHTYTPTSHPRRCNEHANTVYQDVINFNRRH